FYFQAEDSIRDRNVTGVQTCALPICHPVARSAETALANFGATLQFTSAIRTSGGRIERCPQSRPMTDRPASRVLLALRPSPNNKIGRALCRERSYGMDVMGDGYNDIQ